MTRTNTNTGSGGQRMLCSMYSREQGEDLIGSARTVNQFLFLEVPKPWHSSITRTDQLPDELAEAHKEATKNDLFDGKFLFIAPDEDYSVDDRVRFLYFERPEGSFSTYDRMSFHVPEQTMIEAGKLLLKDPASAGQELDQYRETNDHFRELLVCTHTERDPCCGEFGGSIYRALRSHYANEQTRIWQTSHIGGHRLCPNIVDLPDGRYWGRMNLDSLDPFLDRETGFERISDQYRGWCALERPVQILERKAFEEVGWDWRTYRKKGEIKNTEQQEAEKKVHDVCIHYNKPDGHRGTYHGTVIEHENCNRLATPCAEEVEEPIFKSVTQYQLASYSTEEEN